MNLPPQRTWTYDDQQEHPKSVLEWWSSIFLFTTDNGSRWCLKYTFTEWNEDKGETIGSLISVALKNLTTGQEHNVILRDHRRRLGSMPGKEFNIYYHDIGTLKGNFPLYEFTYHSEEKDVEFSLRLEALSHPHYVADDITRGYLPMGVGFYRYGFIPNLLLNGNVKMNGEEHKITSGHGYFEHVWGDFNYDRPFADINAIKKTIGIGYNLLRWFKSNHPGIRLPDQIELLSENNPFGYDWAWAVLDNGWSLFYGNIMLWLAGGPVPGILILTKDGIDYKEYGDVRFTYHTTKTAETFDFIYPDDFTLVAKDSEGTLRLRFTMDHTPREYISKLNKKGHFIGFAIVEGSGLVTGEYIENDEKTIKLSGITKIEPQREISVLGHNRLKILFTKPPVGVGVNIHLLSHYLKKDASFELQLAPRPRVHVSFKKLSYNPKKNTRNH